jgi:UDP-N-acetylglucosamine 2-epimerase (non-hydrolysing)
LVAAKISFDSAGKRPLIAHVEAGLRSFDRTMPEEVNRVVTDHIAELLFVTEPSGVRNLRREGIAVERIHFVGNTMIDSLLACKKKAESSTILDQLGLRHRPKSDGLSISPYALLTLHRPSNVDNSATFASILQGLGELASEMPIVFPVHPRTEKRIKEFVREKYFGARLLNAHGALHNVGMQLTVNLVPPLGYIDFLCLMKHARLVITDSGGIQEETTCLGIPCITVRENTERPITVKLGSNVVAGVAAPRIQAAVRSQLKRKVCSSRPHKWDGKAAFRIVRVLFRKAQNKPRVES